MNAQHFIDAIAEDPTALDRWEVYADWLLERGELRGELISLELAVEAGRGTREIQKRISAIGYYTQHLFTPRLLEQSRLWTLELCRGFVRRADLVYSIKYEADRGREALEALFADPHAVLLEALDLSALADRELFEIVAQHSPPTLRELTIPIDRTIVDRLSTSLTRLERLEISCRDDENLIRLAHPRVRELRTGSAVLVSVVHELPALERLVLSGDHESQRGSNSILSRPPPRLTALEIETPMWTPVDLAELDDVRRVDYELEMAEQFRRQDDLLQFLARPPLATQLRDLTLQFADLRFLQRLLDSAPAFQWLARLAVTYPGNYGTSHPPDEVAAMRAAYAAAFPHATIDIDWDVLLPQPEEPVTERRKTIDADSRGPDGLVNAIAAFSQSPEEP